MKLPLHLRADIFAREKSVIIGGNVPLFPIAEPEKVADILAARIEEIEDRAYTEGYRLCQADMRRQLGMKV